MDKMYNVMFFVIKKNASIGKVLRYKRNKLSFFFFFNLKQFLSANSNVAPSHHHAFDYFLITAQPQVFYSLLKKAIPQHC